MLSPKQPESTMARPVVIEQNRKKEPVLILDRTG
jgi:hypothetical protein